jgi:cell division protein FtsL
MKVDTFVAMTLAVATLSGLGAVYAKHESRRLFMALQDMRETRDELNLEWSRLQLEQGTLADVSVIHQAALGRLEMRAPTADSIVFVRP